MEAELEVWMERQWLEKWDGKQENRRQSDTSPAHMFTQPPEKAYNLNYLIPFGHTHTHTKSGLVNTRCIVWLVSLIIYSHI